jgi:hypothetical protein
VDAGPVVLDGTLRVDANANAATTTMNVDGSTTTSTPVAGRLGSIGAVRGVWNNNVDELGSPTGLDALRLHNAKGTFVIAIDNASQPPAHPAGHGDVYYVYPQRLYVGTGSYAGATESGTVDVTTNSSDTVVVSMTLHSRST